MYFYHKPPELHLITAEKERSTAYKKRVETAKNVNTPYVVLARINSEYSTIILYCIMQYSSSK